jgi:hypothetical protein
MILPQMHGSGPDADFFIYSACDQNYFDQFARELISSIRANSPDHLHLHIFNPRQDQLDHCNAQSKVTVTYEYVPPELFDAAAAQWDTVTDPVRLSQLERTRNAMKKGQDRDLHHRMQKTYYACARFVRLQEIFSESTTVFAADIDAVVRLAIPELPKEKDFYIHHITGKKARFLAGGLWLNSAKETKNFLHDYAQRLRTNIGQDYLYWGIDQDVLDPIIPKYNHGQLPIEYIDWNMHSSSYVWTAKGSRKDLEIFINETKKYR